MTNKPEDFLNPEEGTQFPLEENSSESPPEILESIDPVKVLEKERDDLKDLLLRTHAEFDTIRRRMNREREEERRFAAMPVVLSLLPALDNLQRAVETCKDDAKPEILLQGVNMVLKQIEDALSQSGVSVINSAGEQFDPNFHEALQQVPTAEHPPMTVLQELQKGYKIHDRVVRPSKVIVASEPKS